jgi:hypothetical protein
MTNENHSAHAPLHRLVGPVAFYGVEKSAYHGKNGENTMLAYPDSPRSDKYAWVPLYALPNSVIDSTGQMGIGQRRGET